MTDGREYRRRPGLPGGPAALGVAIGLLVGAPTVAPAADPLVFEPREAPSAAGEMLLRELEGLTPPPAAEPGLLVAPQILAPAPRAAGPANVQVNDPTVDTGERTTQSETSIAVLGDTLCAGYNDSGTNGFNGLARSTDGGATWTDLGGLGQSGDPVIAVHEDSGTFYYASIATIGGNPAIGVATSTDDCQSFGNAVDASPGSSGAGTRLNDKPWIAVDNTGGLDDGNLYVCWTRFRTGGNPSELRFSRSLDGGATFQDEQILQVGGTSPFGCSVGVGPDGEVHVSWADRDGANVDDIRFRTSSDAGQTFSAAVSASTGNRHPGDDNVVSCGTGGNRPSLNGDIRMLHQSWLAVDATGGAHDGNIYVVWASDPAASLVDQSDVFFTRSTDGGATWAAPTQLGTGGGETDQFEPFVAVSGQGTVSVAWYDRRNDPDDNRLIDVYKTFSLDGGATFEPIERVTDQSFDVPPINPNFDPGVVNCYMGEYIAIAADDDSFYYLWGDNRNTLVTTNFPDGRPDPDVFFERQLDPATPVADLSIDKADTPDPVAAGTQLLYTVTVDNAGPDDAGNVVVTDVLPSDVGYVSDSAACDVSGLPALECDLGDIASGGSGVFTITVDVPPGLVYDGVDQLVNTATVASDAVDPAPGDNAVQESTTVVAVTDVEIVSFEALDPPGEILVGEDVELTLEKVITNDGPSAPVDVLVSVSATAPPDSAVVPTDAVSQETALGLGEIRTLEERFTVNCGQASQHVFSFDNEIEPLGATDPDVTDNTASVQVELECVVPVVINIKPGSDPNSVQPGKGTITVAVLTTSAGEGGTPVDFDATTIDPTSVRFGPRDAVWTETGGAFERHGRGHVEDAYELDEVTMDGDLDMVLHFRSKETGILSTDTEACVKGDWSDETGTHSFFGCDAIRIVPAARK